MLSEILSKEAERKWEELYESGKKAGIVFEENDFKGSLRQVFAFSDYVSDNSTRYPLMLHDLLQSNDLFSIYDENQYLSKLQDIIANQDGHESLETLLRHFRRREMVRIAWRDLAGWSGLLETMNDLSCLAEVCLEHALTVLYEQFCLEHGTPVDDHGKAQRLVVIGMGKLGARELNFSSDIDLIFAYPSSVSADNGLKSTGNDTFFAKLCRKLITVFSSSTPDGFVFRIDTNLRPYGENGPLVMSFDGMEDYYLRQGREWERYALIKARIVAGDYEAGSQLLTNLKPFIFRRYLDYGVFDALREMKLKISHEISRKSMKDNIKLGIGGIREIEFFGQIFQLTRGGIDPELQDPSILKIIYLLMKKKEISAEIFNDLTEAYYFLRRVENRLQEHSDRQTHQIPDNQTDCLRLSCSMGFSDTETFLLELSRQRNLVHKHFNTILENSNSAISSEGCESSIESDLKTVWLDTGEIDKDKESLLLKIGFSQPEALLKLLESLRNDSATRSLSREGRQRLDRLMPLLLKEIIYLDNPYIALNRIIDILKAIERRTSYLALLLENSHARVHFVRLAYASPLIATQLSKHPALLDELLDTRTLYSPPRKRELEAEIEEKMRLVPSHELEYQIEQLCIFKQVNVLRVAAADVSGTLPLMRTSDHLTEIAETVLAQVLELCWNHMIAKHGKPFCKLGNVICDRGFAVIGYGKLGGIELGYSSDIDLVFLHAGVEGLTDGSKSPIDNSHFFSRLGQRVIHMLTAQTPAGSLYEVDMRLRPSGTSGVLVSHVDGFDQYQKEKAWTWEHQALVRARPIGGDSRVCEHFNTIREKALSMTRDPHILCHEVAEMRERLRKEHANTHPDLFDIKQDSGGIVDIEFLVQYLTLLKSHEHPSLLKWTDNVRILQTLVETGIMNDYQAHFLKDTYLTYRATVHKLSLQEKLAVVPENRFRVQRASVEKIWKHYMKQL